MATYTPRKGAGWTTVGLLLLALGVVLLLGAAAHALVFPDPGLNTDVDYAPVMFGLGLVLGAGGAGATAFGVYTLLTMAGSPAERRADDRPAQRKG